MTKYNFEKLARKQLNKYGLHKWKFEWDQAKRIFGRCYWYQKTISISAPLFEANQANNFNEVLDTLLHEIAHALAYVKNRCKDHGPAWKRWCKVVGARPEPFYCLSNITEAKPKYKLLNIKTKKTVHTYYRRPSWARTSNYGIANINGKSVKVVLLLNK